MRPGDIAAVAAQRGYAVDTATRRLSHDSFLKQQDDSEQFEGNEGHTESGSVPDDYSYDEPSVTRALTPSTPGVQGSIGGLMPVAPVKGEALGKQESKDAHSGEQSGSFTLGANADPKKAEEKGPTDSTPAINKAVGGTKEETKAV